MDDIHTRRVWSLTSGRLLDECNVEETSDSKLHRSIEVQDKRVELVLKQALAMYERKGADICELFSPPRVCQEAVSRGLVPGWSLDLTTTDPMTGQKWDLSQVSVQNRVRQLIRDIKPFCVIGSPPCTCFSPLQEISRGTAGRPH